MSDITNGACINCVLSPYTARNTEVKLSSKFYTLHMRPAKTTRNLNMRYKRRTQPSRIVDGGETNSERIPGRLRRRIGPVCTSRSVGFSRTGRSRNDGILAVGDQSLL